MRDLIYRTDPIAPPKGGGGSGENPPDPDGD